MLPIIILILISVILTKLGFSLIPPLLLRGNSVAPNFKGEEIPVGYGIIFALNLNILLIAGSLLGYYSLQQSILLITLILAMAFVGLLDDAFGNKNSQGFKGHFKKLILKQELTTGAIKAIFSLVIVFFISVYLNRDLIDIFINIFLVLLMSNFINLLDLRPGRALKVTLLLLLLMLVFSLDKYLLLIPIITILLLSLRFDLKAKGMMGDVGSNVLGVTLGGILATNYGFYIKLATVILLIGIHIYTEFYSLSEFIKKNKILSYLDRLGR